MPCTKMVKPKPTDKDKAPDLRPCKNKHYAEGLCKFHYRAAAGYFVIEDDGFRPETFDNRLTAIFASILIIALCIVMVSTLVFLRTVQLCPDDGGCRPVPFGCQNGKHGQLQKSIQLLIDAQRRE